MTIKLTICIRVRLEKKSKVLNLNLHEFTTKAIDNHTNATKNEFVDISDALANALIKTTTTVDEKFIYIAGGTIKIAGNTKYTQGERNELIEFRIIQ